MRPLLLGGSLLRPRVQKTPGLSPTLPPRVSRRGPGDFHGARAAFFRALGTRGESLLIAGLQADKIRRTRFGKFVSGESLSGRNEVLARDTLSYWAKWKSSFGKACWRETGGFDPFWNIKYILLKTLNLLREGEGKRGGWRTFTQVGFLLKYYISRWDTQESLRIARLVFGKFLE